MGVQGFTSYVEENQQFFNDLKLRNTKIIIDGSSLYFRLYFTSGLDQQHGGDYDSFADLVQQFFEALSACNISPFVVLDGGIDSSDKKFATLKERMQKRIRDANALSRGCNGSVLPLITKQVFKQVLSRLKVPYVQCMSEADLEIACLANQWDCPVLTMDSDFCIFDLKKGYCPLVDFQWNNVSRYTGTAEKYIPARCFSIDKLCSHFGNMSKELVPLFAVIIGNDYINLQAMETFFSQVRFPVGSHPLSSRTHIRIDGLLNWLSQFAGPEEAIEMVVKYISDSQKDEVQQLLSSSMKEYKLSDSNLADYFTDGAPVSNVPKVIGFLPPWMLTALGKGQLASFVIDVLVLERALMHIQVEDFRLPSSNMCSLPIRQVIYGLLLNGKINLLPKEITDDWHKVSKHRCNIFKVEEFDRYNLDLKRTVIQAILPSSPEQCLLQKIPEVPLPVRLQIFLETLGVKRSIVHSVPHHLSLPVCVTCYWLTHSNPKPTLQYLQALVLGMVYGELCRLAKNGASCPEVKAVREQLCRLRVWRNDRQGLNVGAAHLYSQWQASLQITNILNRLLCCPLPEPDCSWYGIAIVRRPVAIENLLTELHASSEWMKRRFVLQRT
ncbi:ASTE1 protein, partial [Amia calva]|nr:ASTE1 protein [Amia calva]